MTVKRTDWVVCGGKAGEMGHCTRCGAGLTLSPPQSLGVTAAAMKAFTKDHASCRAGSYFEKPATSPLEWMASRDTGTSSLTIFSVMTGIPSHHSSYDVPHDPSDFGRCYRLLKLFPAWLPRLPEVAIAYPKWGPMVSRWNEMTALYERELPSGTAPLLYALMKQLEDEGYAAKKRAATTASPHTIPAEPQPDPQ